MPAAAPRERQQVGIFARERRGVRDAPPGARLGAAALRSQERGLDREAPREPRGLSGAERHAQGARLEHHRADRIDHAEAGADAVERVEPWGHRVTARPGQPEPKAREHEGQQHADAGGREPLPEARQDRLQDGRSCKTFRARPRPRRADQALSLSASPTTPERGRSPSCRRRSSYPGSARAWRAGSTRRGGGVRA